MENAVYQLVQQVFNMCVNNSKSEIKDEMSRVEQCYSKLDEIEKTFPSETLLNGVPTNESQYWQVILSTRQM